MKYPFYTVKMTDDARYYWIITGNGDKTPLMDRATVEREVKSLKRNGHDVDDDMLKF